MNVKDRFLEYVKIPTSSDHKATTVPTTDKQLVLAHYLVDEMKKIGVSDAYANEMCYVYGHIPATEGMENVTKIGFIAHMDTSPDAADYPINVQVIENYNGEDIVLGDSGRVIDQVNFPHIKDLAGRTLITTDGNTLLGADDKAGIAEIMTLAEKLISENIPHGSISICFTPDEEVGTSTDNFDLAAFDADLAYTVDGGEAGEVVFENFNAASADFEIEGRSIHPGGAKNRMVNAALVAMEINSMLPTGDTPATTEGYEGFFHLCEMSGCVENATLSYIVRDHNAAKFDVRLDMLRHIEKLINEKYGYECTKLTITQSYRNMEEMIRPQFHVVEIADEATRMAGLTVRHDPIRGGTDGARLSFMGLPTPNLGTGGYAFHGPYEHITVEGMEKSTEILQNIVKLYTERK